MAVDKSTGGAGRSFEFVPGPARRPRFQPQRWLVWWWDEDRWLRAPAPFPEGFAATYADTERRHAGAIAMEAVAVDDLSGKWGQS